MLLRAGDLRANIKLTPCFREVVGNAFPFLFACVSVGLLCCSGGVVVNPRVGGKVICDLSQTPVRTQLAMIPARNGSVLVAAHGEEKDTQQHAAFALRDC